MEKLSPQEIRLITPIIQECLKIIIQNRPNPFKSQEEMLFVSRTYIKSLIDLTWRKSRAKKIEFLEMHFKRLSLHKVCEAQPNLLTIQKFKKVRTEQINAIDKITKSNLFLFFDMGNCESEGCPNDLLTLLDDLKEKINLDIQSLLLIEKFVTVNKGPKPQIIQAKFCNDIMLDYEYASDGFGVSDLPSLYDDFFLSTKIRKNVSKATPLKLALIAMYLVGYRPNEKTMKNVLSTYKTLPPMYKADAFVKSVRNIIVNGEFEYS